MKRRWITMPLVVWLTMASAMTAQANQRGSYGSGGGFVGTFAADLGSLNTSLQTGGFAPLEGPILFLGGGGAGGTLYWNIGGWGGGGTLKSTTSTQEARLRVTLGGFSVQRTVPLGPVLLSAGLLLGGGDAELVLIHKANPTLEEAIKEGYESRFKNEFLALTPAVGMKIRVTDFLLLHVEGCRLFTLGEWKFQGQSMAGLPQVGGSMLRIGLEFGGTSPSMEPPLQAVATKVSY